MRQYRRDKKKIRPWICWMISIMLVIGSWIPAAAGQTSTYAAGQMSGDTNGDGVITVYFTLSNDGEFVSGNDPDETVLSHVKVDMTYFDLKEYGLEKYYRYPTDSFENGGKYTGGEVIKEPTLLHLYIKMLEKYYLGGTEKLEVGSETQNALSVSGSATSLYMNTFWGHDENLMYFVDHKYPLMADKWGATSDYILLRDGMEIDLAMYTDWNFYHTGAFSYFTSQTTQKESSTYEIKTGEKLTLQMLGTATNAAEDGTSSVSGAPMSGERVVWARKDQASADYTNANWKEFPQKTDKNGNITVSFDKPGTYYVSSTPLYETFQSDAGTACVAPPIAVIEVTGSGESTDTDDYTGDLIAQTEFASGISPSASRYQMEGNTCIVPDQNDQVGAFVSLAEGAPSRTTCTFTYQDTSGNEQSVEAAPGEDTGKKLAGILQKGISGSKVTLHAVCKNKNIPDKEESITYTFRRQATLQNLSLTKGSAQEDVPLSPNFQYLKNSYEAVVRADTTQLQLHLQTMDAQNYSVKLEDVTIDATKPVTLKPDMAQGQSYRVSVSAKDAKSSTYTLHISPKSVVSQTFVLTPGSILQVQNAQKENVLRYQAESAENYELTGLTDGETYQYTITEKGYQAKSGMFMAKAGGILDGRLAQAKENTAIRPEIPSLWKNFRGNDENNGVTTAKTPTAHTNSQLYWAKKVGSGYGAGAPSSPILVDGSLVYTTATTIVKADCMTGEIKASGKMATTSTFNITPPTYADGMIFVALADGTIQAFNADTLESLWIYKDAYRGQPNSPITYHDGYIYTGFWNGETLKANFVCLSVTDEKPEQTDETKTATWTYPSKGGFYWSGCYANDDFVLVGTDDGEKEGAEGTGKLIAFDPLTGTILDKKENCKGDIRCSISYDKTTGRYYFASKGGVFYAVSVAKDGTITDQGALDLGGSCTSTPVVSDGRAYVGVKGKEQFGANAGHHIAVIDLASMTEAYQMNTRGYCQTSGLLSTGYQEKDGYQYVYFIENYEPGKIRVLKDKPGQKKAIILRESDYDDEDEKNNDANTLFTPKGEQAQYAICSLICDEYGTMYFHNDSGYVMALGSRIKSIEVTKKPDKTHYQKGEVFDPTGMQVTAYYENGLSRDVTDYVTVQKKSLTTSDAEVEISYSHVLYNDTLASGEHFDPLNAFVDITVTDETSIAAAKDVMTKINAIGTVSISSEARISAARDAFDALESSAEDLVTNYDTLLQAEQKFGKLVQDYWKTQSIRIQVSKDTCQSLKLSWNKVKYADGYEILRATTKNGTYTKVQSTESTTWKDASLKTGTTYYYQIRPYKKSGAFGTTQICGEKTAAVSGKPVLSAVTFSGIAQKDYQTLKLSWKKVSGADGYEIFRAASKNGSYKSIRTLTSASRTSFENSGLQTGSTYYYKIRAYRNVSGKKVYSSSWSAVKAGKTKLSAPGLKAKASGTKVTLSWKKISGASGYVLCRAQTKNGSYQAVRTEKNAKTLKYTDKKVKNKKNYYYKLRAYRIVGKKKVYSGYSKIISIKVKK